MSERADKVKAAAAGAAAGGTAYAIVGGVGVAVGGTAIGITLVPFMLVGAGLGMGAYELYSWGKRDGEKGD